MTKPLSLLTVALFGCAALATTARAQPAPSGAEVPHPYGPPPAGGEAEAAPIPPHAEGTPVPQAGGGYCYVGPHPVDRRVAAGATWDASPGRHMHPYPPIDLRLFAFREGCYHFIGDPVDFGYQGSVYSYYGAHPVLDHHGGGWCFMIGAHNHFWQPWSSHFVVVGPWYYWHGPYDAYFWSYWPYYSFYYRSHYPHYYGGGRFSRGRDVHVAPPIRRVPSPTAGQHWQGRPPGTAGSTTRGTPPQWYATPPGSSGRPSVPSAPSPAARPGGWGSSPSRPGSAPVRALPQAPSQSPSSPRGRR